MDTPPRIAPLAMLPLFHSLAGRKAVVVGTSSATEWKGELLAACGANVLRLTVTWTEEDLEGAAIAVGDFPQRDDASRFASSARHAGALVNIIDFPDESDVQFGTIVNRSPIVIGISTAGAAPMLGQSIGSRIESVLPTGLAAWGAAARKWRPRVKESLGDFAARRVFWKLFVKRVWANSDHVPTENDFRNLIEGDLDTRGRVILINAWPDDADLLTLKAIHALQSATIILHDQAICGDILELARREARRITIGMRNDGDADPGVRTLLVKFASAGETVVYLRSASETTFHQFAPELDACRDACLEVSLIP